MNETYLGDIIDYMYKRNVNISNTIQYIHERELTLYINHIELQNRLYNVYKKSIKYVEYIRQVKKIINIRKKIPDNINLNKQYHCINVNIINDIIDDIFSFTSRKDNIKDEFRFITFGFIENKIDLEEFCVIFHFLVDVSAKIGYSIFVNSYMKSSHNIEMIRRFYKIINIIFDGSQ